MGEEPAHVGASDYARRLESYLCQKNGGHLVRVVGPAFELVRAWAEQGVPLKVAFRGIDRCCERQDARGARRRPVRIEFCAADVLDAFDEWRRAVGVSASGSEAAERQSRKASLASHVERAIARLAHARGLGAAANELQRHIDGLVRELEEMAAPAATARGEARGRLVDRLADLDRTLLEAAASHLDAGAIAAIRREAAEELAPFASRMPAPDRDRAAQAAFLRLVREAAGLPVLTYD